MTIAAMILAAGASTRMGRNKVLIEIEGQTLLRRAVLRSLAAGLEPVLVVVGHEAERVRRELHGLACRAVLNPEHARGMSTSLSAGAGALPPEASAAVVLLADMPLVDEAMIRAVVERHAATGAPLVTARYGEVTAPPTLYARSLFPELLGGEGEGRGREVVRRHRAEAAWVDFAPALLADVDVPDDLRRLRLAAGGRT
jgi:molybdenum cofactor cytidylyltransferase